MTRPRWACAPMSSAGWFAIGAAFLAIGIRQPAFLAIGAAFIAIGGRPLRDGKDRAP